MAIHRNEISFYREEQKILADNRARAQQRADDLAARRQRQRNEQFWAEHAASLKRRMEPPPRPRNELPVLVPVPMGGFAAPAGDVAVSAGPARKSRPSLCLNYKTLDFMERWIWRAVAFVLCAYAALAIMPALYASELNRGLVAFGVSHGVPAVAVLIAACILEFLLLCWLAKLVAEIVAMVITRVVEWVFDMLDFVCGPVLRLAAWMRQD
jgi:hypothetical protein